MSAQVQGYCPMGCGQTLFLGAGGYVTCSLIGCPRPDAATDILLEHEHEHVVTFANDSTFSIKHPLRERLDDALLTCPLTAFLARLDFPPVKAGNYRATKTTAFGWTWTPINTDGCPKCEGIWVLDGRPMHCEACGSPIKFAAPTALAKTQDPE